MGPKFSTKPAAKLENPGPPASQIIHGSDELFVVREPLDFSNAQKKAELFAKPGVLVETLPAKWRGRGQVTFSNVSVTSKSAEKKYEYAKSSDVWGDGVHTRLPLCTIASRGFAGVMGGRAPALGGERGSNCQAKRSDERPETHGRNAGPEVEALLVAEKSSSSRSTLRLIVAARASRSALDRTDRIARTSESWRRELPKRVHRKGV